MKKILPSIILMILVVFILWVLMGWYLGSKLEKTLILYQNNPELSDENDFQIELLSYKRTVLGAKAKFQINFNYPVLGGLFDKIEINAKEINGPIFVNESGIGLGKSHWLFQIDESTLDLDMLESIKLFFPDELPLLNATIGFDDRVHYQSKAKLPIARFLLTGFYDAATKESRSAIALEKLSLRNDSVGLVAEKVLLSIQHQKTKNKTYIPEKVSISIPSLEVNSSLFKHPIFLELKANSHIYSENEQLNGFIKVLLKQQRINNDSFIVPVSSANLALYFNKLSSSVLFSFSEINAEISNLHQQVSWVLEENGQYPEGQDQIWQLNDELKSLLEQRSKILVNKLGKKDAQLHLEGKFEDATGISQLKGALKPSIKNHNKASLFSLFSGEADVSLTADLYNYLSGLVALKKKQFKLVFEDNKLLIYQ